MIPKAITSALATAQALFLPIDGQPSDDNLVRLSDTILPILLKATHNHFNGVHNLWGLVASADCYLHHYGTPFVCPATHLACYHPAINAEASCIDRVCTKTAWATLLQDYEAYKAAVNGIKVFIEAIVNDTWIRDLCNPKTFYSKVTALTIFNQFCKCFGGLHELDMVLLTIQMSQYYEGMPDTPKYNFLLEDAQRKAARACLPITDQNLTVLASTALLAADTFPCTAELWEELDTASKTWTAWKTAYLAAHKKRANRLDATGGADYLGQANTAHTTTLNPGLLNSIDNALNNLASAASNKKAILEQILPLTLLLPPPTLTSPTRSRPSVTNSQPSPGAAVGGGLAAMTPTRGGDLTLRATAGLTATALDMATPATPALTPRKVTISPPCAMTSWAASLPTSTGCPTGPPEAPGQTYKQNISLLRPLIF
jgi:hypothetical protein